MLRNGLKLQKFVATKTTSCKYNCKSKPWKKIAAQPKNRPKRKEKFVIELDNRDPDEGKIVEKTEVERKLDDELDDEERAKNYPRLEIY